MYACVYVCGGLYAQRVSYAYFLVFYMLCVSLCRMHCWESCMHRLEINKYEFLQVGVYARPSVWRTNQHMVSPSREG